MNREEQYRRAIRENGARIARICARYFSDPDDRNDACQESLIRIWENLPGFRGEASVATWVYRVTVNTCLAHLRSDVRRNRRFVGTCPAAALERAAEPAEPTAPDDGERRAFLAKFMHGLGTVDRTLVSLYLEDLSTREMAEVTGISEANVRVRIFRVREKLKKEWEEQQHGTR